MYSISDNHSEKLEWLIYNAKNEEKQKEYSGINPIRYDIEDHSDIVISCGEDLKERPSLYREQGIGFIPKRGHKISNVNITHKISSGFTTSIHSSYYLIKNYRSWVVYAFSFTNPLNDTDVKRQGFVRLDRGKVEYADWSKEKRKYDVIEGSVEDRHRDVTSSAQDNIDETYSIIKNGQRIKSTGLVIYS